MRSRFAAFALGDTDYLWRTLHPGHEDRAHGKDTVIRSLKQASRALKYMRLTVLEARGERVLFLAAVFEKGQDRSFVELSTFVRDPAGWRYLSGEGRPAAEFGDARSLTIASFEGGEG